ncbi:hypothetical protein GCM10027082_47910 [Comamonas humi]
MPRRLATRLGHRRFLVGGSLLYACSSLWFLLVPGIEPQYLSHWLPGLMMSGIAVGVALTVALLGHAALQRRDFNALYALHGALALLTGLLCLPVNTKPGAAQP